MNEALAIFIPNKFSKRTIALLVGAQLVMFAIIWLNSPFILLPTPREVFSSLSDLWQGGLGAELVTSFTLSLEAIFLATLLSLMLAYSTVLMVFRPFVILYGKLRFLSMAGLTVAFTFMVRGTHELKLSLLVFSVSVFFVTGMLDVLSTIPKEQFDLARTLQMGEWEVVWEVIVLGQFDKVFDVLRQNAAMSWMMLTMVEGMARSEGGVGALLLDQSHHFSLSSVMAIQLCILGLGLFQDWGIGMLKTACCPYASLTMEKR